MAGEKPGPPRVLKRRHILKLSPELDKQVDEALEIAKLKVILKPVEATLGNPVAFPLIFGTAALVGGALLLKLWFPSPDAAVTQVRDAADNLARLFWDIEHGIGGLPVPGTEGGTVESTFNLFVKNLSETLVRFWKGFVQLPPIL